MFAYENIHRVYDLAYFCSHCALGDNSLATGVNASLCGINNQTNVNWWCDSVL
ncbi:MAG: hypothetical protein RSC68_31700 [Acinetobacter sp.]